MEVDSVTQINDILCQGHKAGDRVEVSCSASQICASSGSALLPLNKWHLGKF